MRFPLVFAASLVAGCGALLGTSDEDVTPPVRVQDSGVDATNDAPAVTTSDGSSDADADAAADVHKEADAPTPVKRVFVTSDFVSPNFGTLSAADAICATFAQGAPSLAGRVFFAFVVGLNGEAPESRALDPNAPYARMDGKIVFPTGLAAGNPIDEIAFDEKMGNHAGATVDTGVWVGLATGVTIEERTCNRWSSNASTSFAGYGAVPFPLGTPVEWKAHGGTTLGCDQKARLYCFEK